MHQLEQPVDRLIRLPEVLSLTGFSKSLLYQLVRSGQFPKPHKVGRAALWKLSEVNRFISDPSSYSPIPSQNKEGSPPATRGSLDLVRTSAEDSRA